MIVESQGAQRVELGVVDLLRMVVDEDGEVAQGALPLGELGHLPMIDGDPLPERPVAGDFSQLVGMVGVQYAQRFSPDTTVAITSRSRALNPPRPSAPSNGSR